MVLAALAMPRSDYFDEEKGELAVEAAPPCWVACAAQKRVLERGGRCGAWLVAQSVGACGAALASIVAAVLLGSRLQGHCASSSPHSPTLLSRHLHITYHPSLNNVVLLLPLLSPVLQATPCMPSSCCWPSTSTTLPSCAACTRLAGGAPRGRWRACLGGVPGSERN